MDDDAYEYDEDGDFGITYDDDGGADAAGAGGEEGELSIKVSNDLYAAKEQKETDPAGALETYRELLRLCDTERSKFPSMDEQLVEAAFKSSKAICICLIRLGHLPQFLEAYRGSDGQRGLLDRVKDVTRNRAEKAINKILAALSANDAAAAKGSSAGGAGSAAAAADDPVASAIELTISALDVDKGAAPSPLLFNLHMRLARQYLAARTWPALRAELAQIEGRFGLAAAEAAVEASTDISRDAGAGAGPKRGGSGAGAGSSSASGVGGASEDLTRRSSQLLEVCALELSAAALLRDRQRLRAAWKRATRVAEAAVPPPATLGILHEAGGQLAMWAREFDGARLAFLEAFKAFEAAGAAEATLRCLRCHLLANMLSSSRIDPFASQETKAYEREPSIQALTALTDAFQRNDIAAFDPVLKAAAGAHSSGASSAGAGAAGAGAGTSAATSSSSAGVGAAAAGPPALVLDDFSAEFVGDLLRSVRAKALLALLPPYSRVRLTFLAAQLRMPLPDAESLCVSLILDGQLAASIDQAAQVLILKPQPAASSGGDGSSAAAAADGGGGSSGGEDRYRAITRLAGKLQALSLAVPGLGATASGQAAAVAIGKLLSDRGHG